jgi:glycerol-3-phosphate dehydrogenase
MHERGHTLERLRTGTFDVLVIGGGIIGSRVAYEAATADLRTALVDAGDFGGATSSASSKLVHGGPRGLYRIDPSAPDVWAQAQWAVEREWAVTPADVARRTTLAVRGVSLPAFQGQPGENLRVGPVLRASPRS